MPKKLKVQENILLGQAKKLKVTALELDQNQIVSVDIYSLLMSFSGTKRKL